MIILNESCSAVYLPQDDCFQVCELFEGEHFFYYMDREEIESEFNVKL